MNNLVLEFRGDWIDNLKEEWATDEDEELEYHELLDRIRKRTGGTRELVEKVIKEIMAEAGGNPGLFEGEDVFLPAHSFDQSVGSHQIESLKTKSRYK